MSAIAGFTRYRRNKKFPANVSGVALTAISFFAERRIDFVELIREIAELRGMLFRLRIDKLLKSLDKGRQVFARNNYDVVFVVEPGLLSDYNFAARIYVDFRRSL